MAPVDGLPQEVAQDAHEPMNGVLVILVHERGPAAAMRYASVINSSMPNGRRFAPLSWRPRSTTSSTSFSQTFWSRRPSAVFGSRFAGPGFSGGSSAGGGVAGSRRANQLRSNADHW